MLNAELKIAPPKPLYYLIFTLSGFSGLIYESIWSHYLKLFLGHAAYAQSLVLSIYMGGMAVGAWLAGRYSGKWRLPILAYAVVEGVIGVLALVFHNSFVTITDGVYLSLLPGIESVLLAHVIKWTVAALMIVPQSILLGMTFPLMTAGVIRRYPQNSGGSISLLYFTNSIGAAIGVLASGFWLIKNTGLPGTIMTAGLINVLLALAVWVIARTDPAPITEPLPSTTQASARSNKLLLLAAFVTGMASFIYEIDWIRMLSLVLGSSTHAFELMLSAFITGLAFGSLWIRRRIDTIPSPVRFAAYVQIAMGILALLTIPLYGATFTWMSKLMLALNRTEEGYAALLLASHGIALVIMLPTTFCAGMTLPLFTHALLKTGYGEKSIGGIYASNTAGSILGVLFAVNLGLPYLGVKSLIGFGAALDIALGISLLAFAVATGVAHRKQLLGVSSLAVVAGLLILGSSSLSPSQLASGVFRYSNPHLLEGKEIYYYRDGKTASIDVHGRKDIQLTIATNGKPDASIHYANDGLYTGDQITMALLAALPFGFKPDAANIANIGMGSGMTTHTILALPQVTKVDTVEIEPAVVEASREFGAKTARAYSDPRSHIHIEDAKTYFSVHNDQYDIIVSEPSNPWVSGISNLFTEEFYQHIRNYLVDDGIFAQWLHLYENNIYLVSSVLKALDKNFSDYAIYRNDQDILILARKNGRLGMLAAEKIINSAFKEDLANIGIHTADDLRYRFIASKEILSGFLSQPAIPINSDYFPYVDLNAHKAFFLNNVASELELNESPLPILEMFRPAFFKTRELSPSLYFDLDDNNLTAREALAILVQNKIRDSGKLNIDAKNALSMLMTASTHCDRQEYASLWLATWHKFGQLLIANLDAQSAVSLWETPAIKLCLNKADSKLQQWMAFYNAVAGRNPARMGPLAQKLLQEHADADNRNLRIYLLTAAVLGRYLTGETETALELWQKYSQNVFATLEVAPFYLQVIVDNTVDRRTNGTREL